MKINNTFHPQKYDSISGNGNFYTYIESVTLKENKVMFTIAIPGADNKQIEISEPEIIKILPSLLNGEISCCEALHKLEKFLRTKYSKNLSSDSFFQQSPELETRMSNLCWALVSWSDDPFAVLCQYFPHEYEDRVRWLQNKPIKVVSNEIIDAIKESFSSFFMETALRNAGSQQLDAECPSLEGSNGVRLD